MFLRCSCFSSSGRTLPPSRLNCSVVVYGTFVRCMINVKIFIYCSKRRRTNIDMNTNVESQNREVGHVVQTNLNSGSGQDHSSYHGISESKQFLCRCKFVCEWDSKPVKRCQLVDVSDSPSLPFEFKVCPLNPHIKPTIGLQ